MISPVVDGVAAAILVAGAAVWLGGFVTIVTVTKIAYRTLPPEQRVPFFRALGRGYGIVASVALVLAIVGGATLLRAHVWDAALIAAAALAGALVAATVVGVRQARTMTRLRRAALEDPDDARVGVRIRRGAREAVALRSLIGAITVALVVFGLIFAS